MALGAEVLAKGLVVIKGDTAHARAEIAKLSAEEQKAAKARVKAQEEHNAALERSNQRFQLYAAGAVAGWALLQSGAKKYEEHLKAMGAAGEAELKKLQTATGALSQAQDNLQISIGRVAAAAAPAAIELAKMANEIANIVTGIAGLASAAMGGIGGGGTVGWVLSNAGPVNMSRRGASWMADQAYGALGGQGDAFTRFAVMRQLYQDQAAFNAQFGGPAEYLKRGGSWTEDPTKNPFAGMSKRQIAGLTQPMRDPWSEQESLNRMYANNLIGMGQEFFGDIGSGLGLSGTKKKRGGGGAKDKGPSGYQMFMWQLEQQANQDDRLRMLMDEQVGAESFGAFGFLNERPNVEGPSPWQSVAVPQSVLDSLDELMAKLPTREESILHQIFGTPDEINAQVEAMGYATEAINTLAGASAATIQAWIEGGESLSDVFRKQIADGLGAIAGDLAGKSTRHLVEAAAHALLGSPRAAQHLGAAAVYGAGALALGAAAKGIHPGAKTPGGGAGRGNSYAAAGIGGGGSSGPARNANLTVVMGDGFADDSPRYKARRVRRAINQARNLYPESGATEQG